MHKKNALILTAVMLTAFAVGCALVYSTTGKVGVAGFFGYVLCSLSVLSSLLAVIISAVLKREGQKSER